MKSALVLGGGGFLGHHLTRRLKHEGYRVRCVDLHTPEFAPSPADDFTVGDLRDFDLCRAVIRPDVDEIYQLAANMGGAGFIFTGENDVDILLDSATINLNVQRAYRGSRARLLFASSACVYPLRAQGDPDHPDCAEDNAYPAEPDSEYGWEKLFAERVYGALHHGAVGNVSIVRLHNVFGPHGTWRGGREKAPAAICRKVAEADDGDVISIWGDGRQTRSFLFVDECVEGLRRLMQSGFAGPVNLGSEEMTSIAGLAEMVIDISGKRLEVAYGGGPEGVRGRCSDNQLIRRQLGWSPSRPLRTGMQQTYAWVEQQVRDSAAASAIEATGAVGP
ncbi:Nucleoside-diphosphate-sugar epimerase [Geodermatophilus amargosae]|uniref:Nucleoside-diphosphate-sugar epimerase n=1 Tax=Geodermatophilus amargosae TaxID=1296565 RepID=A0A1I7CWB8_9ACTN|nr:NAD-dependent epimerase/dehydratase family protein [Geodermatophilus amargosae]SFU03679.1 Nucleoside-diphosphate-sugar epimerase [Geodermatophilus amargosae]